MTRRATPSKPSPRASNARRQALVGSALYVGYESLGRAARLLPRPSAYAAARIMMQAVWLGWPAGRAAAIENASVLLPHVDWRGDAASLARAQFRRYGEYLVDAVRLDELTPQACFAAVDVPAEDWRRLRERYGSRPTLFALMHMGNWDALGGAYTHACGRSHVLVDPLGHPQLDAAVQGPRDRLGMTPAAGAPGLRRVIEALRGGGPQRCCSTVRRRLGIWAWRCGCSVARRESRARSIGSRGPRMRRSCRWRRFGCARVSFGSARCLSSTRRSRAPASRSRSARSSGSSRGSPRIPTSGTSSDAFSGRRTTRR